MLDGYMKNPDPELVEYIQYRVKDNSGYCIYCDKGLKQNKCPKPCKNREDQCQCGMYVKESEAF